MISKKEEQKKFQGDEEEGRRGFPIQGCVLSGNADGTD